MMLRLFLMIRMGLILSWLVAATIRVVGLSSVVVVAVVVAAVVVVAAAAGYVEAAVDIDVVVLAVTQMQV